jgi:acyl-ACP thioesterase
MEKQIDRKTLKTYQMDRHGLLRPLMLMNELQAIADTHAEKFGGGRTFCAAHNVAWVVTHYLIDILEMPGENEEIEFSTWPYSRDALRAVREFRIRGGDGREMVRATSRWVLIDLAARRPVRLEGNMAAFGQIPERAYARDFGKFPDFIADAQMVVRPRFDDIDVNQHINNAVYAAWATEALGFDFRDGHNLRGLSINFKKEIKAGAQEAVIESKLDGALSRHLVRCGEDVSAVVICEWEKR